MGCRVTNVAKAPAGPTITNAFPAREVNSTRDVLQSIDPAEFDFSSKSFRKGKEKDCVKASEMPMF